MPPTVSPNKIPPNVVSTARSKMKPPITNIRPAIAPPKTKVNGLFNGMSIILNKISTFGCFFISSPLHPRTDLARIQLSGMTAFNTQAPDETTPEQVLSMPNPQTGTLTA